MSFVEWESSMPQSERRHRKLLFLAEIQADEQNADEQDRQRWLDELALDKLQEDDIAH